MISKIKLNQMRIYIHIYVLMSYGTNICWTYELRILYSMLLTFRTWFQIQDRIPRHPSDLWWTSGFQCSSGLAACYPIHIDLCFTNFFATDFFFFLHKTRSSFVDIVLIQVLPGLRYSFFMNRSPDRWEQETFTPLEWTQLL